MCLNLLHTQRHRTWRPTFIGLNGLHRKDMPCQRNHSCNSQQVGHRIRIYRTRRDHIRVEGVAHTNTAFTHAASSAVPPRQYGFSPTPQVITNIRMKLIRAPPKPHDCPHYTSTFCGDCVVKRVEMSTLSPLFVLIDVRHYSAFLTFGPSVLSLSTFLEIPRHHRHQFGRVYRC